MLLKSWLNLFILPMKNEHFFCKMLLIYLQLRRTQIVLCIFLLLHNSYCFCNLYFMHYSDMCALSYSSQPAIVLYCFVGRETLCCLCLNKLLCIVLYYFDNWIIERVNKTQRSVTDTLEQIKLFNRLT